MTSASWERCSGESSPITGAPTCCETWRSCEVLSSAPATMTGMNARQKSWLPHGGSIAQRRWRGRSLATSTWRISLRSITARACFASGIADPSPRLSRWPRRSKTFGRSSGVGDSKSSSRTSRSTLCSRRTPRRREDAPWSRRFVVSASSSNALTIRGFQTQNGATRNGGSSKRSIRYGEPRRSALPTCSRSTRFAPSWPCSTRRCFVWCPSS